MWSYWFLLAIYMLWHATCELITSSLISHQWPFPSTIIDAYRTISLLFKVLLVILSLMWTISQSRTTGFTLCPKLQMALDNGWSQWSWTRKWSISRKESWEVEVSMQLSKIMYSWIKLLHIIIVTNVLVMILSLMCSHGMSL